jgi:hypothetical protein
MVALPDTRHLVPRDAIGDFFTAPVILGFLAALIFLIGLVCLINIAMKKPSTNKHGATIAM